MFPWKPPLLSISRDVQVLCLMTPEGKSEKKWSCLHVSLLAKNNYDTESCITYHQINHSGDIMVKYHFSPWSLTSNMYHVSWYFKHNIKLYIFCPEVTVHDVITVDSGRFASHVDGSTAVVASDRFCCCLDKRHKGGPRCFSVHFLWQRPKESLVGLKHEIVFVHSIGHFMTTDSNIVQRDWNHQICIHCMTFFHLPWKSVVSLQASMVHTILQLLITALLCRYLPKMSLVQMMRHNLSTKWYHVVPQYHLLSLQWKKVSWETFFYLPGSDDELFLV